MVTNREMIQMTVAGSVGAAYGGMIGSMLQHRRDDEKFIKMVEEVNAIRRKNAEDIMTMIQLYKDYVFWTIEELKTTDDLDAFRAGVAEKLRYLKMASDNLGEVRFSEAESDD